MSDKNKLSDRLLERAEALLTPPQTADYLEMIRDLVDEVWRLRDELSRCHDALELDIDDDLEDAISTQTGILSYIRDERDMLLEERNSANA